MTELIWQGKYDEHGKRTAPLRVSLPFQTVETVNESSMERQRMLDLFSAGRDSDWRNRLIWGDKKYVLPSLLDEFAGKVNLIYIDPPFNVGSDFSFTANLPDHPDTEEDETDSFIKEPSAIEMKAYRDTWGRGMDSYLQWFYETVVALRELLAENGSIYIHLDWHIGSYAKCILDEVFGADNFRNVICWQKIRAVKHQSLSFGNVQDTIFFYTKSDSMSFAAQFREHTPEYNARFDQIDEQGKRYQLVSLIQKSDGPARKFGKQVLSPPPGMHWIWSQERVDEAMAKGLIEFTSTGNPRKRQYFDSTSQEQVDDIWTDIAPVNSQAIERTDYPTQKPEALLERIIKASSNENDLILDCFCGSGTTAATAEKLNRRWITCDLSRFSIHTARKRLLAIEGIKPFMVQNLGKYERQAWLETQFTQKEAHQKYREFILDLYHARPLNQHTWLHGIKGGRMVHVGSVDAPVTAGDLANIAAEFKKAVGTGKDAPKSNGVDILGWDFAFELNEVAKQQAAQANLDVRFYRVPRDVMDKRAVEQGDIHFFELAALKVDVRVGAGLASARKGAATSSSATARVAPTKERDVSLTLTDFVIPPDDVPQDVQKAIKHWSQWVDYWAVDWDFKGDTFHNQWQTYRTRKNPDLQKSASHVYEAAGEYTVVVKVIDILGNDTTKTLKVKV
jgi:adenine-specific DNA-methyltransferase